MTVCILLRLYVLGSDKTTSGSHIYIYIHLPYHYNSLTSQHRIQHPDIQLIILILFVITSTTPSS